MAVCRRSVCKRELSLWPIGCTPALPLTQKRLWCYVSVICLLLTTKQLVTDDSEISILNSILFDFLKKISRFRIASDFYCLHTGLK